MKTDEYQLLVALDQEKTIRGAAEKLFISQPAVSQRLKVMEEQWGVPLFIRTHKQLIVTPVGEKVIEFAKKFIKEEEHLWDTVTTLSEKVTGKLSLGISSMVGQYVIPSVLQKYLQQFPDVTIELQTGLSHDITKEANHVSIVRGNQPKDKESSLLYTDRLYLIDKRSDHLSSSRPLIEFQSDQGYHSMVNEWFTQHDTIKPSQVIKVDQIETCKQLMIHGIGMAVLPESAVKDIDESIYKKESLVINGEPLVRKTWLCYSEMSYHLPQVKAFIQVVRQHFEK